MATKVLILLTVLVFLLAACGGPTPTQAPAPKETQAPPKAGPVTITFWHGQSGVLGALLKKRIEAFQATNPDIKVQDEFIGGWPELNQKIMAAAASKALPTMAQAGVVSFTDNYAREGLLKPIEDLVKADPDGNKILADIYPGFIEENTYVVGGKKVLVSWPFGKAVTVVYYNPDLLKAAGFDAPAATWDDFAKQASAIRTKGGATAGWAWTPEVPRVYSAMLWSYGGELLASDWSKVRFNEPEGTAVLEYLVKQIENKDVYVTKGFDNQTDFINGKVGYFLNTVVSRQYILQGLKTFKLGVAPMPAGAKGKATELYGPNAVIFASAPPDQQAAAWQFLKWWTSKENTIPWAVESSYLPVSKSVVESSEYKAASETNPSLAIGAASLPWARPMPNRAVWAEIEPILLKAINNALLGQMKAKAALDEAATAANAKLGK